ncbi:unnamed protein product, partial [Laminaria digitata]
GVGPRQGASAYPRSPESRRKRSTPPPRHGNLFGPVQNMMGNLLQRSVQAVNDALQPGGGATSDDSPEEGKGEEDGSFSKRRR